MGNAKALLLTPTEQVEAEMINLLCQVAAIPRMNGTATYTYAKFIQEKGKPIAELTVAELIELRDRLDDHYRVVYAGVQVQ